MACKTNNKKAKKFQIKKNGLPKKDKKMKFKKNKKK